MSCSTLPVCWSSWKVPGIFYKNGLIYAGMSPYPDDMYGLAADRQGMMC